MKRHIIWKIAAVCLILCMSVSVWTPAQESEETVPEESVLELVNKTDRDIAFLAVKAVEAFGEEDLFVPADDDNLLDEEDVLAADESINVPLDRGDSGEEEAEVKTDDSAGQILQDILEANQLVSSRVITFVWADEEDLQVQFLIVPEDAKYAEICLDEEIAYLQYKAAEDEEFSSTLDAQKMLADPGAADAPASEELTIVSQVAFPNCDDPSHGYYEITYSDGSVDYQEY